MTFSERILGKKNLNGKPHIESVVPAAALPGGELRIAGHGLRSAELVRPRVRFGAEDGPILMSSEDAVEVRVPEGASSGPLTVEVGGHSSNAHEVKIASLVAENLHPVTSPAIDAQGNIFTTFSGSRGQKVPVSIFKIDTDYNVKPFLAELMNATGIAFDHSGDLYVSSRQEGAVYRVAQNGTMRRFAEGMGVATGVAFDKGGNLYVGDRSGTIFKISRSGETFVFATLEPSVSAYHLAFGQEGNLYVTGPTTSSFDAVYSVDPHGTVKEFFRGLGRPQGMAFDSAGNLYVTASYLGRRGIVKITADRQASLVVSGSNIVGLAFAPGKAMVVSTTSGIYFLSMGIEGMKLNG